MALDENVDLLDFVVVGGQRCATGWFAACLREHPEISMGKDESRYLTERYSLGVDWWTSNYLQIDEKARIVGEKCANYLTSDVALEKIAAANKDISVIIIVREPVSRYMSARLMKNRMNNGGVDLQAFDDEDFDRGLFGKYCSQFLSRLEAKNVLILVYEDLMTNPVTSLKTAFTFLGVDTEFVPPSTNRRTKPGAIENRYPLLARLAFTLMHGFSPFSKLYPKLRKYLPESTVDVAFESSIRRKYLADIEMLEKTTGRDFSSWKS